MLLMACEGYQDHHPSLPSCFFVLFRCYCGFVCPTKHIKAPTPCFFVQFAVGSSVPQSTKKHSTVLLRANMFQHSVTVLCILLPCPPTRRAFHAFGAFSVLLWFRLFHKAPKSTNTLLFRAICCGFVCSTKHQNAPKLLFRAHWFQHSVTVLCVRLPNRITVRISEC